MLAKDTVASRLDTGISFTEFSYMILQSYDFLNLYQNHNCCKSVVVINGVTLQLVLN